MAEGNDIGSGAARAFDDSRVDLNTSSGSMDVVKLSGEKMSTGSMQATANASIMDILEHETVLSYVSVAPSTSRGQVLFSVPVDPSQFATGGSPSRVAWIARLFRFWRGDIPFRFIFTKTILQQTKLIAVFVPGATASDPPPSPDNAYFYNHKVVMNPANETEWTLNVPFVSPTPFRTMGSPTGMLYVIMFQNLVVSSADASDIYFSVFVAGPKLQFHELVQLPALPAQNMISPANSFIVQIFGGNTVPPGTSGSRTFLSDSQATLATANGFFNTAAPVALMNGQVVAASVLVPDTTVYDPDKMRTIAGSPFGAAASKRTIACVQQNVASGANYGVVSYLTVYIWSDFSFCIGSASATSVILATEDVQDTYGAIFPSSFNRRLEDIELSNRVEHLESALRHALAKLAKM